MLRVAVLDSGINPFHSHVKNVAGGISFVPDPELELQWLDRIGHGTAVAAAICEEIPEVELYAVKIFDRSFSTRIEPVIEGLEWCASEKMDVVNMSLATAKSVHASLLKDVTRRIGILVAPYSLAGLPAYPGSFPWVFGVSPDSSFSRNAFGRNPDGQFLASPFPRALPEMSEQENFSGSSFAVANFTRALCRMILQHQVRTADALRGMLNA